METKPEGITVYGTTWCSDCVRAKRYLDAHHVAYRWVNIEEDAVARARVEEINRGMRSVPTIVFPDGSVLVEPSDQQLAARLQACS